MMRVVRRGPFEWELPKTSEELHYAGSVEVSPEQVAQAKQDASARVEKAKQGGYRRFVRTDRVQWAKDLKGSLAERVGLPLLELTAWHEGIQVKAAAFVEDAPVKTCDIDLGPRGRWDLKAACDAIPGIQERDDRYFAVNADQLKSYEQAGYAGLVFVRLVNEATLADVWYLPLSAVKQAPLRQPVTENVSAWYAVSIPRTEGTPT